MAQLAVSLAGAALGNFIAPGAMFLGMSSAGIGFAAGSILYGSMQKLPGAEGPRLQDGKITSSAYGQAIPRVWGVMSVAGNVIDASEVRERAHRSTQGGKGAPKQTVTTYSYDADIAVLICEGEIDGLLQIYANEQLIFDATPGATVVQPDWLSFTLYTGTEDQPPDGTLEAIHGAGSVPAYKGLAYVVFRQFQLAGNSVSVNFRFVVARSATPESSETEIDLPGSATSFSLTHSPRADTIVVPLQYGSPAGAGEDLPVLIGIDPYSRAIVWQTSIADGDDFYLYFDAKTCIHPSYVNFPELHSTAIAVLCDGIYVDTYIHFFDAITGASIGRYAVHDTDSISRFCFLRPESLTIFQITDVDAPASISLHRLAFAAGGYAEDEIDPPSGYLWHNSCAPVSDGSDYVLVPAEKDPAGMASVVIITTVAEEYGSALAVDLPADTDFPIGFVWDESGQLFWILTNSDGLANDRVRIHSLTTGGTLTTYDMGTLYSILTDVDSTSGFPGLWLDESDGVLWWQDSSGNAYAWNTVLQDAPATYTGGTNQGGVVYHRGTRTVWGVHGGSAYGLHTAGLTGTAASLQSIVDDLCDGTEIQSADTDTDDLAAVSVRGFAITRDMARRDAIQALRSVYLFDFVPRDGVLTGIIRGGSPSVTLDEDDLGAHIFGGNAPDAAITVRQRAEAQLPRQMDVTYISAAQNYEPVTQTARRLASLGGTETRMEAPVVLTEAEGAQLADVLLHCSISPRRNTRAPLCRQEWPTARPVRLSQPR